MLIHNIYKNLLINNDITNNDISNILSNTWLNPLIELFKYDCLQILKNKQYTRMRFIRCLNNFCENLKNTDILIHNNFLKHLPNYKILKLLDYSFIINNNMKLINSIYNKFGNVVYNKFITECIILYLLNKNNNIFQYLDNYVNNNKVNKFKYSKNILPLINDYLDMGHYFILCYDFIVGKYIIFLMGGSDGYAYEYNLQKLNNYLDCNKKERKNINKKIYDEETLNILIKKNLRSNKILKYMY